MKKLLTILLFLMFLCFPNISFTEEKKCEECSYNKPCTYSTYDGCNTCTGTTWCENNRWYTSGLSSCTLVYCEKKFEIDYPFHKE